jgi:hypothetical protein
MFHASSRRSLYLLRKSLRRMVTRHDPPCPCNWSLCLGIRRTPRPHPLPCQPQRVLEGTIPDLPGFVHLAEQSVRPETRGAHYSPGATNKGRGDADVLPHKGATCRRTAGGESRLGWDSDLVDSVQINHVRGAMVNDARYETAPVHSTMSAQNNFFNVPPCLFRRLGLPHWDRTMFLVSPCPNHRLRFREATL